MRTRTEKDGESVIRNTKFRKCKVSDFRKRRYEGHENDNLLNVHKRICPDMTGFEKFFKLKNDYSDLKERLSFSVEIVKTKCPEKDCN